MNININPHTSLKLIRITAIDYVKLLRPINVFMVSAMALAGVFFGNPNSPLTTYVLAVVVATSYTGIAMIHNDLLDIDIDRINAPNRALPSGRVSKKEAVIYMIILFVIGSISGAFLSPESALIMVLTLVLSLSYNARLKKMGFVGNLTVGITATSAFLYGDAAASGWDNFWPFINWTASIYLFIISAFLNTGREVCKGIMDTKGDAKYGVQTIAVLYGKKVAAYFVLVLVGFALSMTIIPVLNGVFGWIFYIGLAAFIVLILVIGIPLVRNPNYQTAKRFKNWLHPLMLLMLILIVIDKIVFSYL